MEKFSCIIVGGGPAALQAALFLGRANVSAKVIGIPEKSDLADGRIIGNYFGLSDEPPGLALLQNGVDHTGKYGIEVLKEEVVDAEKLEGGPLRVSTETKKEFSAETLIIATGQAHVKAGIQGEDKFFGNGVHTCVACNGIFYKDKKVAVIGSGSHALQEAIELSSYTNRITVFPQGAAPAWAKELEALAKEKGILVSDKRIKGLKGETRVEGAVFADNTEEPMDGLFLALGSASSITFGYKLGLLQKDGFLVIDRDGKTNVEGVWAAGGCTGGNAQIAKSVGEGCNAAIGVIKRVKGLGQYTDQT